MLIPLNIQYLTNEKGIKTAVQIPYKEWDILIQEYSKLYQLPAIKKEIKQGLEDLNEIETGKAKEISLSEFLDEN